MTNRVLRAARSAVEGRDVELLGAEDPVGAIFDRRARIALAPGIAQFEIKDGSARRIADLETIAAVGSYFLHVLVPSGDSSALVEAGRIAAGPPGTPSYKLASAVAGQPEPPAEVVPLQSTSAAAAVQALASGAADAAIVLAPLGETNLAAALDEPTGVGLASGADWWTGAARVGLPFLHEAVIPRSTYGTESVPTLAMQATLVGPAPPDTVLGAQGPSTYSDDLWPVTDQAVLTFNQDLGPHPDVGRYLRPAAALTPQVGRVERALNRTPGYTVLSLGIFLFLAWAGWLLARPAKAERGG